MVDSNKSASAESFNDNKLVRSVVSVLSFVIGMIIGAASGIGAVLVAESIALARQPGFPEVSYGQYFVLVLTPITALIGGSLALLVASRFLNLRHFGTNVGILVGLISLLVLFCLWCADVSRNGLDSSWVVMFPPIIAGATILIAASAFLRISDCRKSKKKRGRLGGWRKKREFKWPRK